MVGGLITLGLLVGLQSAVAGQGVQCPSGGQKFNRSGSVNGVTFQASGSTLTMTNTTSGTVTVSWCAKGGSKFSNGSFTSGVRSTTIPAGQSRSASFNQDVSNFVVYSVDGQNGNGGNPPPENGNGGGGGGGGDNGNGGGPGGPLAPPAPAIVGQPAVTG
ncbi:MAG TPA: hypothetical protein VHI97_03975 [Actinomycetota bacterium]|nr:hypothetical protein [Actinomycetota bacterium]